jgi:long-chain acyl-CoA synthetase
MPLTYDEAVAQATGPDQMFELIPYEVGGVTYKVFKNAPPTLRDFYAFARMHGDKPFLVYEDERRTYAETMAEVDALAAALVDHFGVKRGDRVAVAMRNYPEWVISFLAITAIGAINVSMNAWWTEDEIDYALEDSGATLLIADPERLDRSRASAKRLGCRILAVRTEGTVEDAERWEDVVVPGAPLPDVAVQPEDDATILYTSGTTGRPKGAVSTNRAVVNSLMGFASRIAIEPLLREPDEAVAPPENPGTILAIPLFHVTGCVPVMLGCLISGSKLVIMRKWDPEKALQTIERERITSFIGVPTQSIDMLQHPKFKDYDTSSLLSIGGGGAPPPPSLIKQIDSDFKGGRPGFGYGMTETNALGPGIAGEDALRKPTAAGRVPACMEVEIHDPATFEKLPVGERGEIWFKGPNLIRGYWNNPEATADTFVDGWLRSGDIGHVDEEGFIYVDDRLKDMVLRGGENVYCAEVEAAVYEHPAVHEAAVFGIPDARLGEQVAAVVVPREGESLTAAELQAFLGQKLAAFKVPSVVDVRPEPLPRNPAGKFLKRSLRDELASAHPSA